MLCVAALFTSPLFGGAKLQCFTAPAVYSLLAASVDLLPNCTPLCAAVFLKLVAVSTQYNVHVYLSLTHCKSGLLYMNKIMYNYTYCTLTCCLFDLAFFFLDLPSFSSLIKTCIYIPARGIMLYPHLASMYMYMLSCLGKHVYKQELCPNNNA